MAVVGGNGVAAAAAAAGRGWRRRRRRAAVTRSAASTGLDQQQHCRAGNRTAKLLTCHTRCHKYSLCLYLATFWSGMCGRNRPDVREFALPSVPKSSDLGRWRLELGAVTFIRTCLRPVALCSGVGRFDARTIVETSDEKRFRSLVVVEAVLDAEISHL